MNKTKNNVKSVLKEFKKFVKKYKKQNPRECQIKAVETLFGKAHSKFLFNMCCGAGKTIIESFLIFKEIVDCNKNGKLARVMVASHRLLLNNQLVQIVNDALNSNKITNVEWWSLSSNVTFELGNGDVIQANKFTKDSIDSIKVSDKHIIIVACAASEKKHFKEMDSNTMENILNNELKKLEADNFLNLIVQDEIHKDIPTKVLRNFEKISDKVFGFTATPNNKNIEWFEGNVYEYWFSKALEDGIVVKGKLYISKPRAKNIEKQEASNIIKCFEHLSCECKKMNIVPVFLNYFSSVDNLTHYEKTITNKYGSSVDVAVFASYKEIKDEKGATKVVSQCELNNAKKTKEELLEFCQTQRNKNKPLIILSAYMIVEGIDIPSINGVGIWCEKNDANMFQAACRGCRTDIINNPNKTHFYIYTSEYLAAESKDFLEKLYNGFNEQLDFGDGQEDCEGTGKTNDDDSKNNQDGFIIVPAKAVKTVSAVIEEITLDLLDEKYEKQDIENENYVNSEEFKKHVDKEFKTSKGSDFGTQRKNQAIVESNTNGMFVYFDKRYNQIHKKMNYIERTWMWLVYNRPKVALKAKDEQNICLRYVKNRITLLNICKEIKRRTLKTNKNYDKAYEYIKKHKINWKDYLIFE